MASVKSKSKDETKVQVDGDRLQRQRQTRRRNRGRAVQADWGTISADILVAAISAVTQHGYAIRFGYSKDMGAFAIGIIGDGEPFTEFVRPTEDINLHFEGIVADYAE